MLNSVQTYAQGVLNNVSSPQLGDLQTVIMPPVYGDVASAPIAYIWGGRAKFSRVSAPRPVGWQSYVWSMDVAILATLEIDNPYIETAFPLLLDAVAAAVNTTTMPTVITDPVTGFQTQMLSFGEEGNIDYASVATTSTEGQGLVRFAAEFTLTAEEHVSYIGGYP